MHFVIYGTGGVGGYFGARLAEVGHKVTFIARGAHLQAMKQKGLRLTSVLGDVTIQPVTATDTPSEVAMADVVFLCTKAWQVPSAAKAMRPFVGPQTMVIPLQNGVETPRELKAVLGDEPVLGGFCRIISYVAGPGHINHASVEPYISFGELNNTRTERVTQLEKTLNKTKGITAEVAENIQVAMWTKFLLIAPWSAIGALTRVPVGVWREMDETRQMWLKALDELVAVAQAQGVALNDEILEGVIAFIDNLAPASTASMQRDIMEGRPSELNNLCGAVVRLGLEVGVETPITNFLYHTLLPQEMNARQRL